MHLRAVLWALLLAVLLLTPGDAALDKQLGLPFSPERYLLDLLAHTALLFVMAWSLERSLASLQWVRRPLVVAALVSLLYGLVLELLQSFVPGREAGVGDALANSLGVLLYVGWMDRRAP